MSAVKTDPALWRQPIPQDTELANQVAHARHEHLLLDTRYPQELNDAVLKPMDRANKRFWLMFVVLFGAVIMWGVTWGTQIYYGLGITGLNRPVMWALYIVNFVYFIGIGHAGTFISAALRALKVEWRRPISRAAELVTVFGLLTAAQFPLVHLGRVWKAFWLFPYPNERQLWPSFHSPLVWDLTAITTYLTCSALFVYINLIPDLAMTRDHTQGWRNNLYTLLALGWRGTEREWANHDMAANIFTYAIIPVMFSVHTIVSWDFAMALQPGWHSSIFGPYFVIGALFSGAGAVIIALVAIRKATHGEYFLRPEHFDGIAKLLLVLSLAWDYFYFNDLIVSWYGQEPVEKAIITTLTSGNSIPSYLFYLMLFSNVIVPLALVFKRVRTSMRGLFIVSLFVQIGMYIERVVIIPITLGQNWLPASWGNYVLRLPESLITIGAFSFVVFLFFAASRVIPFIPVWEVYEGQVLHSLRRIGRALISTRTEPH
jgi:Ni/Fe-hydrogenase subunit HybB-like protein